MTTNETVKLNTQSFNTTEKRHILADETYDLLIAAQQEIFEQIDMRITLRKLIKSLISERGVKQVTQDIINKYKE
jgi:hypothetical protein